MVSARGGWIGKKETLTILQKVQEREEGGWRGQVESLTDY